MDIQYLQDLIRKYNVGKCTDDEKLFLEQWYQSFEWNQSDKDITDAELIHLREEAFHGIKSGMTPSSGDQTVERDFGKTRSLFFWWRFAAAAMVIITAGYFIYNFSAYKKHDIFITPALINEIPTDIKPGSSIAQLILADGSVVSLDSAGTLQLKEKDGTLINKQSGKLTYNQAAPNTNDVLFNTLSIPRGGEYQVVLPDGTKVWMNAASTLRYPTRFSGNERKVFLNGEAYFEVAKNARMPFRVIVDTDMTVEVIGTHFNIKAYSDEDEVKTTLVEGLVKVSKKMNTVMLSPSKQAAWGKINQRLTVSKADVEKETAWKNGMIEFREDNLPYIMKQISRWYDVDVILTGNYPDGNYSGSIRRQSTLLQVLEILKTAGVQFKMEGKKVTIMKG